MAICVRPVEAGILRTFAVRMPGCVLPRDILGVSERRTRKVDANMARQDHDLGRYHSAGYVITRPVAPPPRHNNLLPERILSLSSDITTLVPDSWALNWVEDDNLTKRERHAAFGAFDMAPDTAPALMAWVTERFDANEFGWRHVFYSPDTAREFARLFLPDLMDAVLLGMGVSREMALDSLAANQPEPGIGPWGYYEALHRNSPLAPGGRVLGFEVVGLGIGALYSWLSNGWDQIAHAELGIRPGDFGLLATFDEGMRVARYDFPPGTELEWASLWQPWALVQYPL